MKKYIYILVLGFLHPGCQHDDQGNLKNDIHTSMKNTTQLNLLQRISKDDPGEFLWMNNPLEYELDSGTLTITAPEKSDFFVDPESRNIAESAPFLYKNIKGDFVAQALVTPDFSDVWNACALMVHIDSTNWIKFAFENSDATGTSIVSVVTKGVSDDANGVILDQYKSAWLKIIRKGNAYSMHWSTDGNIYKMARLSTLPYSESVKIGMEAQCPSGKSASHVFQYFSIEHKTVENIRQG